LTIYTFNGEHRGRGEELARRAVGMHAEECWGLGMRLPPFARTKHGKPYLEGLPLHFSVSHTGGLWCCMVSESNVGIDVQEMKSANYGKLAERFFAGEEARFVNENGAGGFFDVWVRKEACIKYIGEGLPAISSFSVVKGGKLAELVEYKGQVCFVKPFELAEGVKCAYCCGSRSDSVWKRELR